MYCWGLYNVLTNTYIEQYNCFFFALLFAGILGVVIDKLVYSKLRKQKSSSLVLLIASLGISIFFQNLIHIIYGSQPISVEDNEIVRGNEILGVIITNNQIIILTTNLFLALLVFVFMKNTSIGKEMRAVADDPVGASTLGINPEKVITISFFISSILASIAGILISLEVNIEPTMGFNIIFKGIIASIIGGIGSIPGVLLGGLFLGITENLGIYWIDAGWKDSIAFCILLTFLFLKPNGIFGNLTENERL